MRRFFRRWGRAAGALVHEPLHVTLFDEGLAAKRRRDWADAASLNARALAAMGHVEPGEPAAWNLGIAATALGDWETARHAWRSFGLDVQPHGAAFPEGLGMAPVRLNPTGTDLHEAPLEVDGAVHPPEVVWAERLSPAHARVLSVPTPGSGHRWGDLVLVDGVPHGERFDGRRWVSVFDELALLVRSAHATWTTTVHAPAPDDVEDLVARAEAAGSAAEDWTGHVQLLCATCSAGRPGGDHNRNHKHGHDDHDHDHPAWSPQRSVGLAADSEQTARRLLDAWSDAGPDRSCSALQPAR